MCVYTGEQPSNHNEESIPCIINDLQIRHKNKAAIVNQCIRSTGHCPHMINILSEKLAVFRNVMNVVKTEMDCTHAYVNKLYHSIENRINHTLTMASRRKEVLLCS